MRPVDRGDAPQVFDDYPDAKPFLVNRLGDYCSYCERPIKTNLAVEHVLPKSLHPALELEWSNFLLGCVNCNSTKLNKDVDREQILLPDQDNTFLAFAYDSQGQVVTAAGLPDAVREKAEILRKLVGLNKFPDEFDTEEEIFAALERWQQRSQAWDVATLSLDNLTTNDNEGMRVVIVELAKATGFFSVWMAVFVNDSQMRNTMVASFPGTANDCFDENGEPLNRPNGQL